MKPFPCPFFQWNCVCVYPLLSHSSYFLLHLYLTSSSCLVFLIVSVLCYRKLASYQICRTSCWLFWGFFIISTRTIAALYFIKRLTVSHLCLLSSPLSFMLFSEWPAQSDSANTLSHVQPSAHPHQHPTLPHLHLVREKHKQDLKLFL